MDDVLLHRIDLLIKNIDKVIEDVKQVTSKEFVSTRLLRDATSFTLLQINDQLETLLRKISNVVPDLTIQKMKDFKAIIESTCIDYNPETVFNTATKTIPLLKEHILNIRKDLSSIK